MLERMIAATSIAIAIVCFYTTLIGTYNQMSDVFTSLFDVWLWGMMWFISGVFLWLCSEFNLRKGIEWSCLFTAAMWTVLTFRAFYRFDVFPLTSAIAPIYMCSSGGVFFYHLRFAHKCRKGYRDAYRFNGEN